MVQHSCSLMLVRKLSQACNSRPLAVVDPDLQIRGGGGGRGRSPKIFFSAIRALVWSKNKEGGAPRAPPLDSPLTGMKTINE